MSKYLDPILNCWIIKCDWKDPKTGELCNLGVEEEPRQFVDPDDGKNPEMHFQCGEHHGIVKQENKPEFQLPEGHKLNEDVLSPDSDTIKIEEIEDDSS